MKYQVISSPATLFKKVEIAKQRPPQVPSTGNVLKSKSH